jgi:hypothetical protein
LTARMMLRSMLFVLFLAAGCLALVLVWPPPW